MSNNVSIKDIAAKVGVSTALVSYVLNGKEKEKRVGKEVVQKIREVAVELDYQPNQIARSLRRGSTKTIGLIVADIANPFFGQLSRVIEDEAIKNEYTVIFGSSDENVDKSKAMIDTLLYRQVDGFIIVPTEGSEDQIASLIERGTPVVLIDRYFPNLKVSHVCLENYEATFEATNHLIAKGNKKIVMVAYQSSLIHMQERIRGYREAMKQANLDTEIEVVQVPPSYSRKEAEAFLEENMHKLSSYEAIIFATSLLTLAGLYLLQKLAIKIPDHVRIVGFDNSEAFDFLYSPLTYVEQPLDEMGVRSVDILVELIAGSKEIVNEALKHTLYVRKSS
jgi:LacI family transcriptional regulator